MGEAVNAELAAIEAVAVAYLTAFNRADVPAVLETYADDGILMIPGTPTLVGNGQIGAVYPAVFEAIGFDISYAIKEVVQTGADWAFVRSTTEGTETIKATGDRISRAVPAPQIVCWRVADRAILYVQDESRGLSRSVFAIGKVQRESRDGFHRLDTTSKGRLLETVPVGSSWRGLRDGEIASTRRVSATEGPC